MFYDEFIMKTTERISLKSTQFYKKYYTLLYPIPSDTVYKQHGQSDTLLTCIPLQLIRQSILHVISFVAVTTTDANCTSEWVEYTRAYQFAIGSQLQQLQSDNSTLTECQRACELSPQCVSVDWLSSGRVCYINTDPNHGHHPGGANWQRHGVHYHLVSRCNITEGRCSHDVVTFQAAPTIVGKTSVLPMCFCFPSTPRV